MQRTFKPDDIVVYKPYENCSRIDISGPGKVRKDVGGGFYTVTFGAYDAPDDAKISLWRNTGKFHWTNLFPKEA